MSWFELENRTLRKLKVERWEDEGVKKEKWTFVIEGDHYMRGHEEIEFQTNPGNTGDGLFQWEGETNRDLKQIAGNCDFSLFGMSVSGARKKLKKYFEL